MQNRDKASKIVVKQMTIYLQHILIGVHMKKSKHYLSFSNENVQHRHKVSKIFVQTFPIF